MKSVSAPDTLMIKRCYCEKERFAVDWPREVKRPVWSFLLLSLLCFFEKELPSVGQACGRQSESGQDSGGQPCETAHLHLLSWPHKLVSSWLFCTLRWEMESINNSPPSPGPAPPERAQVVPSPPEGTHPGGPFSWGLD